MKKENEVIKKDCHFQMSLSETANKRNCHAEKFLFSIPTALQTQGKDPEQQHLRMTSFFRCGFTLIELLVVVLIIGILAAVALPQYQFAVEKSHVTEALVNLKKMANAWELYYLSNGKYPSSVNDIDITLPTLSRNYNYQHSSSIYIAVSNIKYGTSKKEYMIAFILPHGSWGTPGRTYNYVCSLPKSDEGTSSLASRICKSLCKTSTLTTVWGSGEKGCRWKE